MLAALSLAIFAVSAAALDDTIGAVGLGVAAVMTALWIHALHTRVARRDLRGCRCGVIADLARDELEVPRALVIRDEHKRLARMRRELQASVIRRMP
jgi:hypothetical protein